MGAPAAAPAPEVGAHVTCKACQEEFRPNAAEVPVGAAIILAFKCPSCGTLHPFARLSAKGVQLRKRLQKHRQMVTERVGRENTERAKGVSMPSSQERKQGRNLQRAYKRELTRLDPYSSIEEHQE